MRYDFNSDKYEVCFWISGHITLVGSSEHINRDAGTRGKNCNLQINFGRKNGTKDTENWNGTLIIDQLRSTQKQCQTLSNIYDDMKIDLKLTGLLNLLWYYVGYQSFFSLAHFLVIH